MGYKKEDYISYRLSRSEEAIKYLELAISNNSLFNAENRIYYSVFYLVSALAIKNNYSTSKHKQLRNWFHNNFIRNEIVSQDLWKIYKKVFDNRIAGDYDDFKKFSIEQVNADFNDMKFFCQEIKKLI
ncbi:MAG: HEPN domain-containing protein [Ignavibacteria bacterium]|nr:HEPN domain-containing protein [Ignavibacteria bacterium]